MRAILFPPQVCPKRRLIMSSSVPKRVLRSQAEARQAKKRKEKAGKKIVAAKSAGKAK
jgi:hypothetical protein